MQENKRPGQSPPVKISIIVPVYNAAEYLPACLDSLVNQTLEEIEIVLVNDGSTDHTPRVMREYAARDSRIRVISYAENRGIFQARKLGGQHASGEYIMFADGDDYLELDACERVWRLETEQPADILNFSADVLDCGEVRMGAYRDKLVPPQCLLYGGDILSAFWEGKLSNSIWNKVFPREFCLRVWDQCEDARISAAEDKYFFCVACSLAKSFRGCPSAPLYHYRYGLGVDGAHKRVDLRTFSYYCEMRRAEDAIEAFLRKTYGDGRYDAAARQSRRHSIRRCVGFWIDMRDQDRPAALRLLLDSWTKPGDKGEIVGALSRCFQNNPDALPRLLSRAPFPAEARRTEKTIRTIGTYYYHYDNGGIQRVLSRLMPLWINMGYRVVFFTDYVDERDYPLPKGVVRVNLALSAAEAAKDYADRGADLERLLKRHEVDVMVYHHYAGKCLLWDLLLCKCAGVPFLLYYHSISTMFLARHDPRFYQIPDILKLGDGVIVLNKADQAFWQYAAPEIPAFLADNPLTFDLDAVQPSDLESPVIVWAARLDKTAKCFFDPVVIMREVVKRVPDARLYIVGEDNGGTNFQRLAAEVARAGLEQSITLCGFQKDVAPYYQSASVFLMTSVFEGFGMSLAEAMSFGLPVVMYDLPYLTLANGNKGVISVPRRDTKAAAAEICGLLEDKAYRKEAGKRARAFLEKLYSGNPVARQWQTIFDSIGQPAARAEGEKPERIFVQTLLEDYRLSVESAAEREKSPKQESDRLRFLFGDRGLHQLAELRSSGPEDKRTVSFVTEIDNKKTFNVLINRNGRRNWVTPDEWKRLQQTVAELRGELDALRALCADHGILPEAVPRGKE